MTTRTVTVARTRGELARARAQLPGRVAVVMTMGALHEGHAALIRAARDLADSVVVTVFVNPLQFGPAEDFDRYPRTFDADLEVCARHGAALVFAPDVATMYPDGDARVRLDPGPMGERFEGAARPGHFAGMLTVVAKLMHLTRPDVAVFGEKDAQQLALVRRMVRDLDLPVHVVGVPTVREPDGLARSSRNRYLTREQRAQGLALSRALTAAVAAAGTGAAAPDVLAVARTVLDAEPGIDLDYLALVDEETFDEVAPDATGAARLVVAGRVGRTRLLDTLPLVLGAVSG